MPIAVFAAVQALRIEQRRLRGRGTMPRLLRSARRECERLLDRAALRLAHRQPARRP